MPFNWDSCKSKALVVLLGVFAAGVVTGGLAMRIYDHRFVHAAENDADHALLAQRGMAIDHLRGQLDLDEPQVKQVEEILDRCIMEEADLLFQLRQVKNGARAQILETLRPDQRERFEKHVFPVLSK
jgi:hypothetical protein